MFFYRSPLSARGTCADLPENQKRWFFSETGNTYMKALAICHECPIEAECLEKTLSEESPGRRYGVAGGMSARERQEKYG